MHIALLTGGISAERPISLRSSEGLTSFIAQTSHTCDVYDIPTELDTFLAKYSEYDIVFPYIHGYYGEDGVITGLCETLGLRYIGSPAITHALCIDKFRTNCVIEKLGIVKVPKSWIPGMNSPTLLGLPENVDETTPQETHTPPVIVKPNCGGSTVATNKATDVSSLLSAINEVQINTSSLTQGNIQLLGEGTKFQRHFPDYTDVPLVQEYIDGEEYTVGVVGANHAPEVLPIMQIVNLKSVLFDWKEKYESDGSNEVFPLDLDPVLAEKLRSASIKIYQLLGCRGVARVDYRVRDGELYFLEVNTFPGATKASFIPKMWQKTGRSMGDFIEMLIMTAQK
ncbi:ATP-grasp domain-containing protein [Candidatus Gracilibacteria bacterium]|nr:ATP-grasp domain-containing protein [Candidatus Gracilibacteria bacterium]